MIGNVVEECPACVGVADPAGALVKVVAGRLKDVFGAVGVAGGGEDVHGYRDAAQQPLVPPCNLADRPKRQLSPPEPY